MALRRLAARFGFAAKGAAAALLSLAILTQATSAEARHYRHVYRHWHYARAHHRLIAHYPSRSFQAAPSPAFSALVVDVNSGRTLFSVAEDGLRHPASITKVMTLYLLFEQLDKGAVTLQSRIPVSEHAAAQEPSKLGVAAGETITVEDAIKAVVTRSANDVAVAIAEAIGGSESAFADMMTRKANALGMTSTVYRNASGLPDDDQVTTAHDLSVLGRSIEERFPRYFKYFSTHEFVYDGQVIGNHNHLLGRVDGVDGIKTGYTRGSGFNLLTSVHRDGRSLIAVVMGGRTAGARDRVMENLIEDHLAEASTVRTAVMLADAEHDAPLPPTPDSAPRPHLIPPATARTAVARPAPQEAEGDNEDNDEAPSLNAAAVRPAAAAATEPKSPAALGWAKGPDGIDKHQDGSPLKPASGKQQTPSPRAEARNELSTPANRNSREPGATTGKGWLIQLGATDNPSKAAALLASAQTRSSALAAARPLTEKFEKGRETFYRARFAGLDSASAENACRSLRRSGFSCFASRE